MASDALATYLNDHLAGATLGCDHARQLEELTQGTPFGATMSRLAKEIEEDRDELRALMERAGVSENPVKKAGAWLAEKVGRPKLSNDDGADDVYLALEAMSLGVAGKQSMWEALAVLGDKEPALAGIDLDRLIQRAIEQRAALEAERLATAPRAFA